MKSKTCMIVLALFAMTMVGAAGAEEKFGVPVYPGAKYHGGATDFLKQMSPEAAAYRTGDPAAKVMAYYKKQPGVTFAGGDEKGGMFRKGKFDVTVQNPWMDTKTGKMINETLISIVKRAE